MLAYNAIRTACTAVLQQNLHQQSTWTDLNPEQLYWQLCVFWNVYIADRTISISCGRPASFHKDDISIETCEEVYNRVRKTISFLRALFYFRPMSLTLNRSYYPLGILTTIRSMTLTSTSSMKYGPSS
jgi:hypothetical protein